MDEENIQLGDISVFEDFVVSEVILDPEVRDGCSAIPKTPYPAISRFLALNFIVNTETCM